MILLRLSRAEKRRITLDAAGSSLKWLSPRALLALKGLFSMIQGSFNAPGYAQQAQELDIWDVLRCGHDAGGGWGGIRWDLACKL